MRRTLSLFDFCIVAAPAVPNWGGFSEFMIAATLFTRFADGEIWTHIEDKSLHLLCREGSAAFEALPSENKHMGPWTGREGEVDGPASILSLDAGGAGIRCHLRARIKARVGGAGRPAWPTCRKRRMPTVQEYWTRAMYHGLRDKECPRCGGRGWIKSKP